MSGGSPYLVNVVIPFFKHWIKVTDNGTLFTLFVDVFALIYLQGVLQKVAQMSPSNVIIYVLIHYKCLHSSFAYWYGAVEK